MSLFPDCFTVIQDTPKVVGTPRLAVSIPKLVAGAPRLVAGTTKCFQVHPMFSLVLRGVLNLIINTPMVLLYQSSEIPVTLKAGRNALLGSDTLLGLTHQSLHSRSSRTLLETSSDYNIFC